MTVSVLWHFLAVPLAGLQCVIVVFPYHTNLQQNQSKAATQKKIPKYVFKTDNPLMQVTLHMSILQYFRPALTYHLSLSPLFVFFEWPLKTGLLYFLVLIASTSSQSK